MKSRRTERSEWPGREFKMTKTPEEWLEQANNDIRAAEIMFRNRQNIYAIFMCHLCIEKALKGIFVKRTEKIPPKIHNLVLLTEKTGLEMPEDLYEFVVEINRLSVVTRYPDDLKRMMKDYNKKVTEGIMKKSREVLKWLKKQY